MFNSLGTVVVRFRWIVIAVWVVAAIALTSVSGRWLYDVTTSDQKELLSEEYESIKAADLAQRAFGEEEGTTAVTALVKRDDGQPIAASDKSTIATLAASTTRFRPDWDEIGNTVDFLTDKRKQARVVKAEPGLIAPGGKFQLVSLAFKGSIVDPATQEAFKQSRDDAVARFDAHGLNIAFTGGIASHTDHVDETESTQGLESMLLYGGIALLTLLFFRGILAAIIPLLAVVLVAGAASGLIVLGANLFDFKLEASTPTLITTVLIGIGIDYFLFLLFRHRERLRAGDGRKEAAVRAVSKVGAVIASAALAIVIAFASLAMAEFGQFQMLGPAVAIAVLVMLLAGVTFFPALVAATGRAMYWPSKSWQKDRSRGPAARLGALVARRPAAVVAVTTSFLVLLAVGLVGAKLAFDVGGQTVDTQANRVEDEIAAVVPRGATDPVQVFVEDDKPLAAAAVGSLTERLAKVEGIGAVSAPASAADGRVAEFDLSLEYQADSNAAMELVRGPIRGIAQESAPEGAQVLVGGKPAVFADVSDSVNRDLRLILPVAAALILLILILLLRSVVAPAYLLLAVGLEFIATFGAAVLVFQHMVGREGVAFSLPVVLYLFVVALGTDYNMLIASRLREESDAGRSIREATANAVRFAAPAMAAAGLALAAAFGSLMLYPDETTKQMGFAMAIGILLASFVVSSLLVPAFTALIGEKAWWPSRRRRSSIAELPTAETERPLRKAA
ncbi:MAG: MMPL family transporter [Gaiellaceae bacterium]